MHIAIYYPGEKPVPPPLYGGGQRAMYWLGKALIELGHRVTLIAHPDSHIPGADLRPLRNTDPADESWKSLIPDSTDIVHLRRLPKILPRKPFVMTVGGNGRPGQQFHPNSIFVSRKHAENHGSTHFVHNGVDPDDYQFCARRENFAVFLAKASWDVKNLRGAIHVCREAGVDLHVIGSRNWPLNLHRLVPAVRGIHYYGTVGQDTKVPLLSRARWLVFPIRWHEPFANALNEALVSGCAVIGTPYGCMPEIVNPTVGALSSRAQDLIEAMRRTSQFEPQLCRERVLKGGFTHLDMAKKYLAYYEKVINTGGLGEPGEPAPKTRADFLPNELLPWEQ